MKTFPCVDTMNLKLKNEKQNIIKNTIYHLTKIICLKIIKHNDVIIIK